MNAYANIVSLLIWNMSLYKFDRTFPVCSKSSPPNSFKSSGTVTLTLW